MKAFNIEYRPQDFDEIIGNSDIIESLQSIIQQKNPPHSYLFHGNTGCGKTTIARILARHLGSSQYDIIEINSSNNRGIDTARDIITQMNYKPLSGKSKTYILDEVHQATKDFQNGILKALEDSPDHVFFILCTTEPEKLLKTIQNRCSQFQVSRLNIKMIMRLLKRTLEQNKKEISKEIMELIGRECEGIPRQALIMLQQIIDIKNEEKAISIIQSLKSNEKQVIDLCRALNDGKSWSVLSNIIKNIEADPENVRRAVLGYFSAIALNSKNEKAAARAMIILENFEDNYYDSGKAGLLLSIFRTI